MKKVFAILAMASFVALSACGGPATEVEEQDVALAEEVIEFDADEEIEEEVVQTPSK